MTQPPEGSGDSFWSRPSKDAPRGSGFKPKGATRRRLGRSRAEKKAAAAALQQQPYFGQGQGMAATPGGGRRPAWLLPVVVVACVVFVLTSCSRILAGISENSVSDRTEKSHQVVLTTTSNGLTEVSWSAGALEGSTAPPTKAWTRTVEVTGRKVVVVSVQPAQPTATSSVTCTITIDGVVKDTVTQTGPDALASCTGATE